jgi:orotidine-5'-phosphate decarboxylase
MSEGRKRIAVALDASERSRILDLARLVGPEVGVLKVGLEAFCAHGPELAREVAALAPVFLDLKLHDIPNTVGGAAAAAARTGASILNVHAGGGLVMMRAAGERAREAAAAAGLRVPRVIAVTVLTSLDAAALSAVGLAGTPREAALRLALLARQAGLGGVVCSPEEIAAIRSACGPEFLLVVPGIRPAGSEAGDQKRIATPGAAARAGADLLVIGRPITGAPDPAAAARAIAAEIDAA